MAKRVSTKLRAGIVGAGLIAVKKHMPAFRKQRGRVFLAAVCDLNEEAAREAASTFRIPGVYTDLFEMLAQEDLDLLDICTPPSTHARLAVEAMKHGCHVLIEKPMALSVADCDSIVSASKEFGAKVCIVHSDLFYWPFMKAREVMEQGRLGSFRGMRIFLSTPTDYMTSDGDHWVHKLPGDVIAETGPHVVYLSLPFIGPIREVTVNAMKLMSYPWSPFEDYRIDLIGDRGMSSVTLSYATNQWMARVDILGSEGTLILDLEGLTFVKYRRHDLTSLPVALSLLGEAGQIVGSLLSNATRSIAGRLGTTQELVLSRFLDSIRADTASPVPAEEGREVVRVTNMILERLDDSSRAPL